MTSIGRCKKRQAKQMERAIQIVHDVIKDSVFFAKNETPDLPLFLNEEVVAGKQLGEGEFSTVREVTEFKFDEGNCSCRYCNLRNRIASEEEEKKCSTCMEGDELEIIDGGFDEYYSDLDDDDLLDENGKEPRDDRCLMKYRCIRGGDARYAIKILKRNLTEKVRSDAIVDLAIEAKYLTVLSHPNIIRIRGTGKIPCHPEFFLVLDRLYETLEEKNEVWRIERNKAKGKYFGLVKKKKPALLQLWRDRLLAIFDVARAMKYIHSENILFRDLKPENVGFDVRGTAKIFDFGLVKELLPQDRVDNDQYRASGLTGSRRYMSPEVALCQTYGKPADVYSFAIMAWEVVALKIPFDSFDCEKHDIHVVRKGKRPKISSSWPACIKTMFAESWSADASQRPTFNRICEILKGALFLAEQDASTGVSDRTMHLLDKSDSSRARYSDRR